MQTVDQSLVEQKFCVKLTGKLTVLQAFQCCVYRCATHIRANEAGVKNAAAWNAENLHQMRVGIRRLRAAMTIFKSTQSFPPELIKEIKWLNHQLSASRDWDVLSESTLPELVLILSKAGLDTSYLTPLQKAVNKRTQKEHVLTSSTITSSRYTTLIRQLEQWATKKIKCSTKISLIDFSRVALTKTKKRLRKCNINREDSDPTSLHELRIAAKKYHYAIDFFKSLHPSDKQGKAIKKITKLQDKLGTYNDIVVALRLLNEIQTNQMELAKSVSFVRGFLAARLART